MDAVAFELGGDLLGDGFVERGAAGFGVGDDGALLEAAHDIFNDAVGGGVDALLHFTDVADGADEGGDVFDRPDRVAVDDHGFFVSGEDFAGCDVVDHLLLGQAVDVLDEGDFDVEAGVGLDRLDGAKLGDEDVFAFVDGVEGAGDDQEDGDDDDDKAGSADVAQGGFGFGRATGGGVAERVVVLGIKGIVRHVSSPPSCCYRLC